MSKVVLSILVNNTSGVLSRVAGLFSRRGYNIDSLTVGETEDPAFSRMTVSVTGDGIVLEQIEKQVNKLEDVIKILDSANENGLDGKVTSIDISNKNEYSIYIEEENKKVHLGDSTNLSNKMLYVMAIIEAEKGKQGDIFVNGDLNNKFQPYFREKV